MNQEKRLSLSFGDFACDIVGYDDPFTILNRVMELFTEVSKTHSWIAGDTDKAKDIARGRFADQIAEAASNYDLQIDDEDGRFVVSRRDVDETTAETISDSAEADAQAGASDEAELTVAPAQSEHEPALSGEEANADAESEDEVPNAAGDNLTETSGAETPEPLRVEKFVDEAEADATTSAQIEAASETATESAPPAAENDAPTIQPARQPLRLNASPAPKNPGAHSEGEQNDDESVDAEEPAKVDATPEAKSTPAVRPRIVVDTARSRPYRKPDPEKAKAPMPGLRFSVTQNSSSNAPAEDHAGGLKAKTAVLTTSDLGSEDFLSKAPEPTKTEEAPLLLTTPVEAAVADEEPTLVLETPATISAADEVAADEMENGDNLFQFDESEPATETKSEMLTLVPAETEAESPETTEKAASTPVQSAPRDTAKKKTFGFGMFRKSRNGDAENGPVASDEEAAFDRLRETATAALPELDTSKRHRPSERSARQLFSVSDSVDLEQASSPAAFARQVGASSLQDLLEASAAYMAIVEGKAKFSRREVMHALSSIGPDKDYSPEARLKSFRKLVTLGAIVPSEDGMFTISHATRFGYENQLRA